MGIRKLIFSTLPYTGHAQFITRNDMAEQRSRRGPFATIDGTIY